MTGALRTLALLLFGFGVALALVGTGGYSSAAAERGLTAATAPDENAYVGYDSPDEIAITIDGDVTNGTVADRSETVELVTLTNRFGVVLDVTDIEVDQRPDDLTITVRTLPSDISPGGSGSKAVVAELECEDTFEAEPLSVTVRLRGNNVEAVVFGDTESRTISTTCRAES